MVVWYGGVVPCIRSCSARIISVNDGYFEFDVVVIVVDGGGWLVDFVVTAFDDWAYSVLFDKLAIDDAGAATLDKDGGGGGVPFRLFVVVVVCGGGGGGAGAGGTDGTLNLNGSADGCSGGSAIISIWETSLFVAVLLVRRRRLADIERSLARV